MGLPMQASTISYYMPVLSVMRTHTVDFFAITAAGVKTQVTEHLSYTSQNSLFDESYYLQQNPDVAAAVNAGIYTSGYGSELCAGRAV